MPGREALGDDDAEADIPCPAADFGLIERLAPPSLETRGTEKDPAEAGDVNRLPDPLRGEMGRGGGGRELLNACC